MASTYQGTKPRACSTCLNGADYTALWSPSAMKPAPKSARSFQAWRNDCIGALRILRAYPARKRKNFNAREIFETKSGAKSLDGLRSQHPSLSDGTVARPFGTEPLASTAG